MLSSKIRTYILDDEPLSVEGVSSLLEMSFPGYFEVVGTQFDPVKAVEEINDLEPQLIFIDIEMPRLTGFEVVKRLRCKNCRVVFVTAYDEYAVEAFEMEALDYLLKPINPKRFQKTLNRVIKKLNKSPEAESVKPNSIQETPHEKKRIGILAKDGYHLVPVEDIKFAKADNNYTEFYLESGKKMVHSKNLKSVEEMLPSDKFIRLSRFAIVRTDAIDVFNPTDGGFVVLKDGSKHSIGYTYRKRLKDFMKLRFLA